MSEEFWKTVKLEDMTRTQWESLCDGCGKCCLSKLEDEDTGKIYWTSVVCRLFDAAKCACKDYENRASVVPDCVILTPENVRTIPWLPKTCAYRLVAEGKDLYDWHPLVSRSSSTVHEHEISVLGKVTAFEDDLTDTDDYLLHLTESLS
jgi:uncharacterized protein